MSLAIFDLDETLLAADSCSLFCRYLLDQGIVGAEFVEQDEKLMAEYACGRLDQNDYIRFFIGSLNHLSVAQIDALMPVFIRDYITPVIYPQAQLLLKALADDGQRPLIISATSAFIVRAVAKALGVADYIAIELQEQGGHYTGLISGIPSFREGKVVRLQNWLQAENETVLGASFYSDSINDLPLLEQVDYPIATNPDQTLRALATERGWKVLDWSLAAGGDETSFNDEQHFTNAEQTHV